MKLFLAFVVACALGSFALINVALKYAPVATSPLMVKVDGGHGTGIYLGNGFVLTANHIPTDTGVTVNSVVGQVVWADVEHDVKLLRLIADLPVTPARINCAPLYVGQRITKRGFPQDFGETYGEGYVASPAKKLGHWEVGHVAMLPLFFGDSGGPVFNDKGEVVAMMNGLVDPPISFIVPMNAVCSKLPRQ